MLLPRTSRIIMPGHPQRQMSMSVQDTIQEGPEHHIRRFIEAAIDVVDSTRRGSTDRLGASGYFDTDTPSTSRLLGSHREHQLESTIETDLEPARTSRTAYHRARLDRAFGETDTSAASSRATVSQRKSTTEIRAHHLQAMNCKLLIIHELRSQPRYGTRVIRRQQKLRHDLL